MPAKLYTLSLSHPSQAAHLMLERKGIEHRVVELQAGVEEAEAWGERELQPVPRRIFRWAVSHDGALRRWLATEVVRLPAPSLMATGYAPLARMFARMAGASTERVRADVAELPRNLDRVDRLIADGTIGGDEPNAADFQIATTVRMLLSFEDLRDRVEGRPAAALAMPVPPGFPGPIPRTLPAAWL